MLTIVAGALCSCQPANFRVLAAIEDRAVVFRAAPWSGWPFSENSDLYADMLSVRDASGVVWAIERDHARPGCATPKDHAPFPVRYGHAPRCYVTRVAPQRMVRSTLYFIDAQGLRFGSGYYRVDGSVENYDYMDVEDELRGWNEVADPFGTTVSDPA